MRNKLLIVSVIFFFLPMVMSTTVWAEERYFDGCNWCVKDGSMTSCTNLMCKFNIGEKEEWGLPRKMVCTLKYCERVYEIPNPFYEIPNPFKEGVK